MERYVVSARKYRPQTFESVVGQKHITNTLENAIANNHLAQALLFCGPRGVGKTTCARILAKCINESDNVSEEDFSLNIFELDAASNNSVEDIRRLIDQVRFAPQVGQFKVYIIDEVHMLSQAAFNAFLKTLEEPPAHAIFILATTEKHKIIPTILSRCQIFDFKRITVEDIAQHLAYVAKQEGIEADPEGLHIIAQKADGALRDALSIFDRLVSFNGNTISYQGVIQNLDILDYDYFFKATDLILQQDLSKLLLLFNDIMDNGFEGIQFINGLASHFRDLLVSKDAATVELLEVGPSVKQRYLEQSQQGDIRFLVAAIGILNTCDIRYKTASNQRLLVESSLMDLIQLLEKKKPENGLGASEKAETESKPKHIAKPPKQRIEVEVEADKKPENSEPAVKPSQPKALIEPKKTALIEETESKTETEKVSPPQPPPAIVEAPKAKSNQPDWMAALKGKSGVNLKTGTSEKKEKLPEEEDETQSILSGPKEVFSEKEFEDCWAEFLNKIEHRKSIFALLSARKPQLKNLHEMHFELENNTQISYLTNVQGEMLGFMREKLRNYNLKVIHHIKAGSTEKRPYTAEERYRAMVAANPALESLRKALDMEID